MKEKKDNKLNEILRIKIKEFGKYDDEKKSIEIKPIAINIKHLNRYKTLVKENDDIRIIKHLNPDNNNISQNGYPFVKDLITLKINCEGYYKKSKGIIKIRFIELKAVRSKLKVTQLKSKKNKYTIKPQTFCLYNETRYTYKRLLSSSNNVRNCKVIFVNDDYFDKVNTILLCGMAPDMDYDIFAKFNSYYALTNTDSTPVPMPNFAVIEDYEKDIKETFHIVRETDKDTYEVDLNVENHIEKIKPFDGAALVDISLAEIWAKELGLNYIPTAFQFRCIPGIKGNAYVCNFRGLANRLGKKTIKDCFKESKTFNIKEDNINMILTKSCFKFIKQYYNYEDWKSKFGNEDHGYPRTFNISGCSDDLKNLPSIKPLSYQPLQSLELNSKQIEILCKDTVNMIRKVSTNVDEFLKFRGLIDRENEDENENKIFVPDYYEALKTNKALFNDGWMQSKIQGDIKGFKERAYKGGILVNGNYQTLIPCTYSLALFALGNKEPDGLLKAGQIYSKYWLSEGVSEISAIRFPHIANEHQVLNVINSENEYFNKFFKPHIGEGIYTNIHDSFVLKANSADFDGDKILTNSSKLLIQAIKEQKQNTIVFMPLPKVSLNDSDKKAKEEQKQALCKINDMDKLIKTDLDGMKGDIGVVINQITKLWSLEQTTEIQNMIKIMSVVGSLTIDFAKSGVAAAIPAYIKDFLKEYKKPYFMRYVYEKQDKKERKINKVNDLLKLDHEKLFDNRDCTMNRICHHMERTVKRIKLEKSKNLFDWTILLSEKNNTYTYNDTYPKVLNTLLELKEEYDEISKSEAYDEEFDLEKMENRNNKYKIFYGYAKNRLLQVCNDIDKLIDYMLIIFYSDKTFAVKNDDASLLWNTFGKELTKRLKFSNNRIDKKVDASVLIERSKRLKEKIQKIKGNSDKVYLEKIFKIGKVSISKDEIKQIKNYKNICSDAKRLTFVLLVLSKLCLVNEMPFEIHQGKKNRINKTHICKLAGISDRAYKELMPKLKDAGIVELNKNKFDKSVIDCEVNIAQHGEGYVINDINECKKYFGKIA